jgi:hypothetical protein
MSSLAFQARLPALALDRVGRLLIGAFAACARFSGVHKIETKSFQATVGQPDAEAISIRPFVGFQHATVETLERFRWWCILRNRRRTEANEHDQ